MNKVYLKNGAHRLGVVCDEHRLLGIYRDDGEEKRIFSSIIYNTGKYPKFLKN